MTATPQNKQQDLHERILQALPQKKPFRFVDRIVEVDSERICGQYHFQANESFYAGHFPGNPVTPGVMLLECMAQIAVNAHSLYQLLHEGSDLSQQDLKIVPLFTDVRADFMKTVGPDTTVTVKGEKLYWKQRKLKSKVSLYLPDGELAVQSELAGMCLS